MPWMRYKSGGRHVWRRGCRHCQVISEYRDAVFARRALRESGEYMQYEDDEFDEEHPHPRFKDWLVDKAAEWRAGMDEDEEEDGDGVRQEER